jgi:4-amino-4-deoxy-L-arabinose transferase-like glycosyltransferase
MQETVTAGGAGGVADEKEKVGVSAMWMRIPGRTRVGIAIFILCLLVYVLVMVLVPRYKGMPTTQGDEPHYLLITESILHDGDVFLTNNYQAKQYLPYFQQDITMWHVAHGRDGRFVSTHPMALSVLVLPGFWLFGYTGAALTMILLMSAAAALSFLITDRFVSRGIAAGVTVFLFFTYPLVFYSRLIYPETVAVFLVALGVWSAWRLKESAKPLHAALLGLSAGALTLFHPKFVAISIGFLILFFIVRPSKDLKLLAWMLAPAAACTLLLVAFTSIAFGTKIAQGLTASGGSKFQGGYWGTNSVWGIGGLFIDRAWGLLIFAPVYGLFLAGLVCQKTELEWDRWWIFFPVVIGLHTLVLGVFQSWNGGAAPVQRYLVPLAPLFLMCIALFIDRVRSKWAWGIAGALALYQIVMTVWGFRFMVGTFGMEGTDNIFLEHFLANGVVKRFLLFVFPLLHPAGVRSVLLICAWLLFFAVTTWLARRHYMRFGGGKLPPAY